MNRVLRAIAGVGISAGAGYLAYRYLLTPTAQENLLKTVRSALQTGQHMAQQKEDAELQQEAARVAANQAWVAQQWEKAGY